MKGRETLPKIGTLRILQGIAMFIEADWNPPLNCMSQGFEIVREILGGEIGFDSGHPATSKLDTGYRVGLSLLGARHNQAVASFVTS